MWDGFTFAIQFFALSTSIAVANGQFLFEMNLVRFTVKSILMNIIYRKTLKLHYTETSTRSVGNIVNLVSNDSEK